MTKEIGTFARLNLKEGDVVRFAEGDLRGECYKHLLFEVRKQGEELIALCKSSPSFWITIKALSKLEVVSRASEPTWDELSDEAKSALLLAKHNKKEIQFKVKDGSWAQMALNNWAFHAWVQYRVKPKPEVQVQEIYLQRTGPDFSAWKKVSGGYAHLKVQLVQVDGRIDFDQCKVSPL